MLNKTSGELSALRRNALIDFCLHAKHEKAELPFPMNTQSADDLWEWLRSDPLDSDEIETSWVAEAVSCLQAYILAVLQKFEPGYDGREFDPDLLEEWELTSSYGLWSASKLLLCTPEDYITPYVRIRKTGLFRTLESYVNQTSITDDSVLKGAQRYLRSFEETCNMNVLTGYLGGANPLNTRYYLVGRQRVAPFGWFWREAHIELAVDSSSVNPTAWREWKPADIPTDDTVLDCRMVYWEGRPCMVWAQWRPGVFDNEGQLQSLHELEVMVAFIALDDSWSPPIRLHLLKTDKDVSKGCRLVAVVLRDEIDTSYPKGRLAVHVTNAQPKVDTSSALSVAIYETRDSLFRKVKDETAVMDYLANHLFVERRTLQQKMRPQLFPAVDSQITKPGTLAEYLGIKAYIVRNSPGEHSLWVQGHCAHVSRGDGTGIDFTLAVKFSTGTDPEPLTDKYPPSGGWATKWLEIKRSAFNSSTITVTLTGAANNGARTLVLTVPATLGEHGPLPYIHDTDAQGAQFLAFNQPPSVLTLKYVRLNTLIGHDLVLRSSVSIGSLLDWATQFPKEPPLPEGEVEPNGPFDGANGLFFWELFFHLPHLIAVRLRDESRFEAAQRWLHFIFEPQAPAKPAQGDTPARPQYWHCRPLDVEKPDIAYEVFAPGDPDAIAYSSPWHYQIVIFLEYVNIHIAWGDWLFRQMTRDSLTAAKLQYVRARSLMGARPDTRSVNRWVAKELGELVEEMQNRSALADFEKTLQLPEKGLPVRAARKQHMGVYGTSSFKIPVSPRLLTFFDLPDQRIDNIRHGRTIDGKLASIPLFTAMDPSELLNRLAAGSAGPVRPMGGQLRVAVYRWDVLFNAALQMVQHLQELGNEVQRLLEQQDRVQQETLERHHLTVLGEFTRRAQEESIAREVESLTALQHSRTMAEERELHYADLYDKHISPDELTVMEHVEQASRFISLATGFQMGAAVIHAFPNVFGMANGGHQPGHLVSAVGFGFQIAADVQRANADKTATSESYRRRREEWRLLRNQATAEKNAISAQIAAQERAINAARINLEHTLAANSQALKLFEFLQTRATNLELYQWLMGQLQTLHFRAYDAAIALCLSAQTALRAETCEFDAYQLDTDVWRDQRRGLTAGVTLQAGLLRMRSEYLQRRERRQEIVKTVSLQRLFDDPTTRPKGFDNWAAALDHLVTTGTLDFELIQLLFDRDYHDHYCRQISRVEVSLPVLTGPFENVVANLVQVGSYIATKPSSESLEYLHSGEGVAPVDVLINLSSGQQVSLSTGLDDTGTVSLRADEGMTLPFENTGAVSRWQIVFPWHLKREPMLLSLTDIVIKVFYTAKVGDLAFSRKVQELVNEAERKVEAKGTQS
ncbi:neuraminidase-like domain-containing protein [Pseudomonas aphyarum]|uniref:Neuraminidase-like domain-containing protein n=1 Tax=Pseudomonas aphyarum TaxID=2942629 RepID=A0ABT5PJT7_9PSED|nr:neuraminidase-like domain-containing protein [Pseudomonas aphyarum]MDD0970774.1 neuraminidase-like domain-containing protein [Pseudomonas aphyarum]MDD1123826.1 neuraminidase-like domain-containing protein [Pseudomonas aphyarum]